MEIVLQCCIFTSFYFSLQFNFNQLELITYFIILKEESCYKFSLNLAVSSGKIEKYINDFWLILFAIMILFNIVIVFDENVWSNLTKKIKRWYSKKKILNEKNLRSGVKLINIFYKIFKRNLSCITATFWGIYLTLHLLKNTLSEGMR